MKTENDFYVGQKLYIDRGKRIEEVTISSIGKKYFYLERYFKRNPIDKETLTYKSKDYSDANFTLVKDKQEILDRKEKSLLIGEIRNCFVWNGKGNNLSLEDLRKISEILKVE
jgi:hypothetical protein